MGVPIFVPWNYFIENELIYFSHVKYHCMTIKSKVCLTITDTINSMIFIFTTFFSKIWPFFYLIYTYW